MSIPETLPIRPGRWPLAAAANAGKAAKVHDKELIAWLGEQYGFTGPIDAVLTYFGGLGAE